MLNVVYKYKMRIQTPYKEDYATCEYTHAWLRIMDENLDPDEITKLLSIPPSKVQFRGDFTSQRPKDPLKNSGWVLSSENLLDSKDSRHHLDWILEQISDRKDVFQIFHNRGYLVDICVRWDSKNGHGGPTLNPDEMKILSDLEIELWFDLYLCWIEDEE